MLLLLALHCCRPLALGGPMRLARARYSDRTNQDHKKAPSKQVRGGGLSLGVGVGDVGSIRECDCGAARGCAECDRPAAASSSPPPAAIDPNRKPRGHNLVARSNPLEHRSSPDARSAARWSLRVEHVTSGFGGRGPARHVGPSKSNLAGEPNARCQLPPPPDQASGPTPPGKLAAHAQPTQAQARQSKGSL